MKISFAICTHNEGHYINDLLSRITTFIQLDKPSGIEYEIIVVDDYSTDNETIKIFDKFKNDIILHHHVLDNNFSQHKNFMNSCCTGDWILNLDADEYVSDDFMGYMSLIIELNPDIESYWIPRVNTVHGLTLRHLQKWGWMITKLEEYKTLETLHTDDDRYKLLKSFGHIISEEFLEPITNGNVLVTYYEPIVAWPDYQMRLYKNNNKIHWINKVHERLTGFSKYGMLPQEPTLAIQHFKDIQRQEIQNNLYEQITS